MSATKYRKPTFADFLQELIIAKESERKEVESIPERKYYLIVTEGERTEPYYFNYFKNFLPRQLVSTITISGEGDNTVNIVQKSIILREERRKNILLPDFDEVWAVYDKDDFPAQRFNKAVKLAIDAGIKSAHSNQAFELWYILHFRYLDNDLHRNRYLPILADILGFEYKKNDENVVKFIFDNGNVRQAIQFAKKLDENSHGKTPSGSCPSTKVHLLVEKLLEYCNIEDRKE